MPKLKVYFSVPFQGALVQGYCPLLKVGQCLWVSANWKGQDGYALVEYSAERSNLLRVQEGITHSYRCIRPYVRAFMS